MSNNNKQQQQQQQQQQQGYQPPQPVQGAYALPPDQQGNVYTQPQTIIYTQGPAPDAAAENLAMILFIVGIFVPIVGWINMCLHCGSTNARAKSFAKYSAIVCLVQFIAIVALVVLEVVFLTSVLSNNTCSSNCVLCFDRTSCQMDGINCHWETFGGIVDGDCMSNSTASNTLAGGLRAL